MNQLLSSDVFINSIEKLTNRAKQSASSGIHTSILVLEETYSYITESSRSAATYIHITQTPEIIQIIFKQFNRFMGKSFEKSVNFVKLVKNCSKCSSTLL